MKQITTNGDIEEEEWVWDGFGETPPARTAKRLSLRRPLRALAWPPSHGFWKIDVDSLNAGKGFMS
jgi:hypothetical protein